MKTESRKGVFIEFRHIRTGRRGQIALFLVFLLIIILVASISLINVGKVGLRRLRTANASDSAALAGASALASVANNIAEANERLKYLFAAFQLALLSRGKFCLHPLCTYNPAPPLGTPLPQPDVNCPIQMLDYAMYKYYVGTLLMQYLFLQYSSKQGFDAARADMHRTVFGNAKIEEAPIRNAALEIQQSRLGHWLNKEAVNDPAVASPGDFYGASYTFRWWGYGINIVTGKEEREQPTPNNVTSTVTMSDCAFALDPMPFFPAMKEYKMHVTGIHQLQIPKDGCATCKCGSDRGCFEKDMLAFEEWAKTVQAQCIDAGLYFAALVVAYNLIDIATGCSSLTRGELVSIFAAIAAALGTPVIVFLPVSPPKKQCLPDCTCTAPPTLVPAPKPAVANVLYIVPIPWINDITNDDRITVTSTVNSVEPAKEMGFWRRRQTSVTSSATARVISTGFCAGCYDAELTGAN